VPASAAPRSSGIRQRRRGERRGPGGHPIGFGRFLRYGGMVALLSMLVSSAYVWVRYLL
jgi:hypothetical protein